MRDHTKELNICRDDQYLCDTFVLKPAGFMIASVGEDTSGNGKIQKVRSRIRGSMPGVLFVAD